MIKFSKDKGIYNTIYWTAVKIDTECMPGLGACLLGGFYFSYFLGVFCLVNNSFVRSRGFLVGNEAIFSGF